MDYSYSLNKSLVNEDSETVELFISCRALKNRVIFGKSNPLVQLEKHVNANN